MRAALLLCLLLSPAAAQTELDTQAREAASDGKSLATGIDLAGDTVTTGKIKITTVKLDAGTVVPSFEWHGSTGVHIVENYGLLRRITVPALREERRFAVAQASSMLASSKSGLALAVPGAKEIWLFRETDLSILSKTAMPTSQEVVSSPLLTYAFVTNIEKGFPLEVRTVDFVLARDARQLGAMKVMQDQTKKITAKRHPQGQLLSRFDLMAATPDGRYVFFYANDGLHRFRVEGFDLVYEEYGPKLGKAERLEISPDSQYIAAPAGDAAPAGHPEAKGGTYIYKVGDLAKPAYAIPGCRMMAFSRGGAKFYGTKDGNKLGVFTSKGTLEQEIEVTVADDELRRVAVHPSSGKLLILTRKKLLWMDQP